MACCEIRAPLFVLGSVQYNVGLCTRHVHHSFFNAEVSPFVRANNGVMLVLHEAAQHRIRQVYDGTPLFVEIAWPCCSCPHCYACNCCTGCGDCDCARHTFDEARIDGIWFGRTDAESSCPTICNIFACSHCCNHCRLKRITISHAWVQLAEQPTMVPTPPLPIVGVYIPNAPVPGHPQSALLPEAGVSYGTLKAQPSPQSY